eukprot:8175-Heterococcus_DN1.PRE.4
MATATTCCSYSAVLTTYGVCSRFTTVNTTTRTVLRSCMTIRTHMYAYERTHILQYIHTGIAPGSRPLGNGFSSVGAASGSLSARDFVAASKLFQLQYTSLGWSVSPRN